jgi:hypothetical protein
MRMKRLIENEEDFDKERKEDEGRRRWVKDKERRDCRVSEEEKKRRSVFLLN